jgi:hypothetical protein
MITVADLGILECIEKMCKKIFLMMMALVVL